jgi:glycosyltransferase involved in cell wall biosynthesis
MNPAVSIIIPLYNKEAWIERTLASVSSQTFSDWEAIIIDDGSTDQSVKIVERYIDNNPGNWVLIKNSNAGQCKTRNSGVALAKGEFVAFLDADDIWSKNKLLDQVGILRSNKDISLVICPYIIFSDVHKNRNLRLVLHKDTKKTLMRWLQMRGYGAGTESTGMTRTELLRRIGGFDENLSTSAGLKLTIELANRGKVEFSKNSLMAYRIHTGQWHSNTEMLSRDMAKLRNSSIQVMGDKPKALEFWHSAYITLVKARQSRGLLGSLLSNNNSFKGSLFLIFLTKNIFFRNFASRIRGRFVRQICGFSLKDFNEFISKL